MAIARNTHFSTLCIFEALNTGLVQGDKASAIKMIYQPRREHNSLVSQETLLTLLSSWIIRHEFSSDCHLNCFIEERTALWYCRARFEVLYEERATIDFASLMGSAMVASVSVHANTYNVHSNFVRSIYATISQIWRCQRTKFDTRRMEAMEMIWCTSQHLVMAYEL